MGGSFFFQLVRCCKFPHFFSLQGYCDNMESFKYTGEGHWSKSIENIGKFNTESPSPQTQSNPPF